MKGGVNERNNNYCSNHSFYWGNVRCDMENIKKENK